MTNTKAKTPSKVPHGWRTSQERQLLLENLTLLLNAGVGVETALESVKNELRSKRLYLAVAQMQTDIDNGLSFSKALGKSHLLPDYVVSLIKIGEDSGQLTENLEVIIRQQEKDRLFRSKLRSAMLYPAIIFGLALVVGMGIGLFLLPRLATLFSDLNVALPLPTRILISIANIVREHGLIVFGVLGGLIVLIFLLFSFIPAVRQLPLRLATHLPIIGRLIQNIELARFGYITGSLLQAGLPIVEVFQALASASRLPTYRRLYSRMSVSIAAGDSFKSIFAEEPRINKFIPRPLQELIIAGEQSGKLAPTLSHLGEVYEEKIDTMSKNLATLLEPIMLVFVWLMVVGIALAVILPIYRLIGGLR